MFQEKVASSSQTTAQALFIITTNRLRHEAKGGLHTSHSMKQDTKRSLITVSESALRLSFLRNF